MDLVALLSMVGDTWFLAYDSAMFSEEGAKLSRVARSSRVTRLVRLAKIARAGRLLPRLLRLVWRQQMALARTIMLKKVWRVFLFLDSDGDGLVSMLDLKVFYFSILQECEHMLSASRQALLCMDVGIFESEEAAKLKREGSSCDFLFTFQEFSRIFLSTRSGKDMLKHYTRDIEQATTVWAVTNKLSDTLALKTCLLVLLLVVAMSAFEIDAEDRSPEQGLAQLDRLARTEHSHNQTGGAYLCSQIAVYRLRHEVLLLFLAGKTYFESGTCSPSGVPPAELDPFARAETLVVNMGLRASEVLQACTPSSVACSRSTSTGMVLLDLTAQAREESLFALLTMVAVVSLLIIFVLVLKVKIQKFTGMLVNPLRSVADDMVAMSSLEILTSNGDGLDSPFPESRSNIFELQLLQEALQSMRMTIRSWSLYVPPCVVQRLFSKGIEATIGVAKCTVSVLFCDIDGFEDTCADLSPQEVLSLLSLVLGKIADVIEERQGTVLEFIGDEVLAVFNTPEFVKHHVYSAVASALEIHRVLDGLPKMITDSGKEITVRCRCGVNTGSIFAGNIGSKNRMKYGLLGDGVNLAARLKTLNSLYGTRTLVSAAVIEDRAAGRLFVHRPVDAVAVKGKKQPTVVFEVLDGVHTARDLLRKAAAKHREGFTLYRERQFEEASRVFSQAASLFAAGGYKEHVSPVLRRRCNALIEKPPPEDWDGVERLTRKNWEEVVDDSEGAKQLVDIRPDGTWRQDSTLITLEALDALEPLETPKASLVHKCTPQVLSF
uniref:Guanylate cyclase domain-containing protein n=1 Tax=Alexandrium andersonii TaxID=327968 RepID=A0A7S2GM37_9DINO